MKILFKQKVETLIGLGFTFLLTPSFAQEIKKDSTKTNTLEEVTVKAIRADEKAPVTFTNVSQKDFSKRNLGQDIPVLLNYLPSVVTTTDAGNGVGYTGIRVRGNDATRVNVTVNGIPYNDSESHGTYWVNMPDIASSTGSIQLQRGVGTSTNGAGAFGASLNLATEAQKEASGEISNSYGSFNTHKHTLKYNTGLLNDHFILSGRLSQIKSSGYLDRAFSDLKSYFLQGNYISNKTTIKALVFGGKEHTYQAWNGIDTATLATNSQFNSAGIYNDEFGIQRYYNNETDNYQQDHAQLHWNQKFSDKIDFNLAFHYTKGKGFYENYKEDADFLDYGMTPTAGQTTTDLVRQKWLDNDFYGSTFSLNYKADKLDLILGGAANKYNGKHFGTVIWARYASTNELGDRYYNYFGNKTDANTFLKATYTLFDKLSIYGDLQFRNVNYQASGVQANLVNDNFNFFNPKAGITYSFNEKMNIYGSYAKAHREPNRTDYENGTPRPEKLNDFELGWRFSTEKIKINLNGYYMLYKDQLVLTGKLDGVGSPIRENSGNSYRLGFEADAMIKLSKKWLLSPNISVSESKNKNFYSDASGTLISLGNTNIAYSPKLIVGNNITFMPIENVTISMLSKFVGKQYLNNINDKSSYLNDYFINDFNFSWNLPIKKIFKEVSLNVLCNNIFNRKYVSNGADYGGGYIYYYPQAGANYLAGLTLKI